MILQVATRNGEAKLKIFLTFLLFLGGRWGEPTKNGKEIFGFASPFQTTK